MPPLPLTNETSPEFIIQACGRADCTIDITDLSPSKIRALPPMIEARILFGGDTLTLHAKQITQLSAADATRIHLPKLASSQEILADKAEISAPQLENGGRIIAAKYLNDTYKCDHVSTLILTGETIILRGVRSIIQADFLNARHVFLHDTEIIGSRFTAHQARHIAAPSLQTLTGFFNTQDLRVITLNQGMIDSLGSSSDTHISPNAEIRACNPEYCAAAPT